MRRYVFDRFTYDSRGHLNKRAEGVCIEQANGLGDARDRAARVAAGAYGDRVTILVLSDPAALSAYRQGGDGWRPKVRAFASAMEERLRANDHKGRWKGEFISHLMARLFEEAGELQSAVDADPGDDAEVLHEAADVANFAMMVADACDALPSPPKEDR